MTAIETSPTVAETTTAAEGPPYVGPRAFRVGEALYGREQEAKELIEALLAERILLCHGPSGGGKTSLVQALVIPALRSKFSVLGPAKVGRPAPSTAASASVNRYVLSTLLELAEAQTATPAQESPLGIAASKPVAPHELVRMTIADYLDRCEAGLPEGQRVLLIFDQFEEILSLDSDDTDAKHEFFRQLGVALQAPHRWALFVVDEEYVAALDHYVHLVPTHLAQHYALDLLQAAAAKLAIIEPAKKAGVSFTDGAVNYLIEKLQRAPRPGSPSDVRGRYIEPVQLQVVCTQLWRRLPPALHVIERSAAESIGDVDIALAEYYADTVHLVSESTGVSQRAIRTWIGGVLIHDDVRAHGSVESAAKHGVTSAAIDVLCQAYLIRVEQRHAAVWYELAHDRLIEPIKQDNARWLTGIMSPVERYATTWLATSRPRSALLSGKMLRDAKQRVKEHPEEIVDPTKVKDFLVASSGRQREVYLRAAIVLLVVGGAMIFGYRPTKQAVRDYNQRRNWASYGISSREIALANKKLHVTYFTRPQDGYIESALAKLGYEMELYTDTVLRPQWALPNQIKYGRNVDTTGIKLVLLALNRADPQIRIQYICSEDEGIYGYEIQVRYAKKWADSASMSPQRIHTNGTVRGRRTGRVYWNCP